MPTTAVSNLTCEYQNNLLGISEIRQEEVHTVLSLGSNRYLFAVNKG